MVGARARISQLCRIFDVSNAYKKKKNGVFLKDRFRGGRWYGHGPQGRGLGMAVPKKGRVGAWLAVQKSGGEALGLGSGKGFGSGRVGCRGTAPELAWWTGRRFGRGVGARWQFQKRGRVRLGLRSGARGGSKFGAGKVGGRGTGPATCVVFLRKIVFFEALWGGGGYKGSGRGVQRQNGVF